MQKKRAWAGRAGQRAMPVKAGPTDEGRDVPAGRVKQQQLFPAAAQEVPPLGEVVKPKPLSLTELPLDLGRVSGS